MEYATLHSGQKMPLLGLGTWKSKPGQVEEAVRTAIDIGYRHIDCAHIYGNEKEIGSVLKEKIGSVCSREELFITSKLWNTNHRPEDVRPQAIKCLEDLGLTYLDLFLIHWPVALEPGEAKLPKNPDGSIRYDYTPITNTWRAMEKLVDEGLVRHIGLSNFNSKQIDEIKAMARLPIAVNQCEAHVYLTQNPLINHCKKNNIVFTAYSPLGSPNRSWAKPEDPVLLDDPKIKAIGDKYNKSTAQVLIRFQAQKGVVVIPKSVTPTRIKANFEIFDFVLSDEDMATLEGLNRNWRACNPTVNVDGKLVPVYIDHPHYPFHEPF